MSRRLLDKLPKMMEDPEFAAAWEDARDEFSIAREIIRTRVAAGMSQKELAEKIGTTQSVIARLESGQPMSGSSQPKTANTWARLPRR